MNEPLTDTLQQHREALAERPHTTESLAELFKRKPCKSVEDGLLSLVAVGPAEYEQETITWYAVGFESSRSTNPTSRGSKGIILRPCRHSPAYKLTAA